MSLTDVTTAQIVAGSRVLLTKTDALLEQLEGRVEEDGCTILEELEATLRYHLLALQRLTGPAPRSASRVATSQQGSRLMMRVSTAAGRLQALTGAYALLEALAAAAGDTECLELAERHRQDLLKLGVELQGALPRLLAAALSTEGRAHTTARVLSDLEAARAAVNADRQPGS